MNQKGQIAFESLLVLVVIITTTILITTLYIQLHDETLALGYARTTTLEEISITNSDAIIEKISLQKISGYLKIIITLDKPTQLDAEKISNIIKEKANIQNITVEIQ